MRTRWSPGANDSCAHVLFCSVLFCFVLLCLFVMGSPRAMFYTLTLLAFGNETPEFHLGFLLLQVIDVCMYKDN